MERLDPQEIDPNWLFGAIFGVGIVVLPLLVWLAAVVTLSLEKVAP